MPGAEFGDPIIRVELIIVPFGPVPTVGVASGLVVGVTEIKMAGVKWTLGSADGVGLKGGLDEVPTGPESVGEQVADKEETVLAGGQEPGELGGIRNGAGRRGAGSR